MIKEEFKQKIEIFTDLIINKALEKKSVIGKSFAEQLKGINCENFYLTEENLFRPIGYVYPNGEDEFKFINYYQEIHSELIKFPIYQEIFDFLQKIHKEKLGHFDFFDENSDYFYAQMFLNDYTNLLSRNIIHYSSFFNLLKDNQEQAEAIVNKSKCVESKYKKNEINDEEYIRQLDELYSPIKQKEDFFINNIRNVFIEKFICNLENLGSGFSNKTKYKFFFTDINLEDAIYEIDESLIIRQIKLSDKKCLDAKLSDSLMAKLLKSGYSETIVEYENFSIHNERNFIFESFQLLCKNFAKLEYEIIYQENFQQTFINLCKKHELKNIWNQQKYTLSRNILNAYKKVLDLSKVLYFENNEELEFLKIAKDFYIEALTKPTPTGQITYACLCLEALFNSNKNLSILNQLKTRMPYLLGLAHIQITNKKIDKAYDYRSNYVHGRNPKIANKEINFAQDVLDYTRYSLLLFLILVQNIQINEIKKKILKSDSFSLKNFINEYLIHNAIISKKDDEFLKSSLGNVSWIKDLQIDYIEAESTHLLKPLLGNGNK